MKVEVGQGAVTKSVVAMRLSNLTADVKNWSSDVKSPRFIALGTILRFVDEPFFHAEHRSCLIQRTHARLGTID